MRDALECRDTLSANGKTYHFYSLARLGEQHDISKLPYSLKILLENLLRHEDGENITEDDVAAIANWDPKAEPSQEIAFTPARVVLQDFTGVPAIVDLAAMRSAMDRLGGDPQQVDDGEGAALADGLADLPHPLRAGIPAENPAGFVKGEAEADEAADERETDTPRHVVSPGRGGN